MRNGNSLLVPAVLLLASTAFGQTANVPGDFATIQEALDAAANGDFDVIQVSKGQYRENLVIETDGVTLKAKGPVIVDGAYAGTCLEVTANDVTVTGIDFLNGGPDSPEGEGGGILYTGSGANITKCEVRHCVDFGIQLIGTGHLEDNLIVGTLGPGLLLDSGDSAGPLTTVEDNDVLRNDSGILGDDGPFQIEKCQVSNNTGDGIVLTILAGASEGTSTPTTIRQCTLSGNGGTGLLVDDEIGQTTVIEKNTIDSNGVGLDLTGTGMTVSKNEIDQSLAVGAYLQTTDLTFDKNKMRRNTLMGILVTTDPDEVDGNNTFTGNHFQTSGGDGVHVESNGNVFEDNLITDNLGDGLQVATGASANQVIDNTVKENGHDGIDNWGTDTLITDNSSKANVGADLAGVGDGTGTVDAASGDNVTGDDTGLESEQELELDTLPEPAP